MDEKLQQLVDDVLLIERGYTYEKRSIKSQRQGEIFKKVDDFLNEYLKKFIEILSQVQKMNFQLAMVV